MAAMNTHDIRVSAFLHHLFALRQGTYVFLFYIITPHGYDTIDSSFLAFRCKTIAKLCQLSIIDIAKGLHIPFVR